MTPFYKKMRQHVDALIKECQHDITDYIHDIESASIEDIINDLQSIISNSQLTLYQDIIKTYQIDSRNFPSIDTFVYTADGCTLRQRIRRWINEYNKHRDKSLLIYRISLITKHGHRYIDEDLNLYIVKRFKLYEYVTTAPGTYGESCEHCRDNHGTFAIQKNFMLPPYHPDCDCIYWFHHAPIASDEPEDEDWMPEQEGA